VLDTSSNIIPLPAWAGVRISVREEELTSCCKSEYGHQHSLITFSQGLVDVSRATSNWVEPEEMVLLLIVTSRLTRGLWLSYLTS
jgi:hypothetical protein